MRKRNTICLGLLLLVITLAGCTTESEPWVAGVESHNVESHGDQVRISVETYLGGFYRSGDTSVSIANVSVLLTDREYQVIYRENVGRLNATSGYEKSVNATLDQAPHYILLQPGMIDDPYNGDYTFEGLKRRGGAYVPTISIQQTEETRFGIFHSTAIDCNHEISCAKLERGSS